MVHSSGSGEAVAKSGTKSADSESVKNSVSVVTGGHIRLTTEGPTSSYCALLIH